MTVHDIVPPQPDYDRIAEYYRQTRWQYRGLWTGSESLALHYGYWDEEITTHVDSLHRMNYEIVKRAHVAPGDRILDAGCGWGGTCIWLVQNYDVTAVGLNIEPEQIEKANEKAVKVRVVDKTRFTLGDFHQIPEPAETFDVVLSIESVCHSTDKARFAKEAWRVLKPGGRIVVSDYFRTSRDLAPGDEALLQRWLGQWVVEDLATVDEFEADLNAAGFNHARQEDVTANIRRSAQRMCQTGVVTAPLAVLFRLLLLPFYTRVSHDNWKSSMLQYEALQRGAWRYRIVSALKV